MCRIRWLFYLDYLGHLVPLRFARKEQIQRQGTIQTRKTMRLTLQQLSLCKSKLVHSFNHRLSLIPVLSAFDILYSKKVVDQMFNKINIKMCVAIVILILFSLLLLLQAPLLIKELIVYNSLFKNSVLATLLTFPWKATFCVSFLVWAIPATIFEFVIVLFNPSINAQKKYFSSTFIFSIVLGMLLTQTRSQFELTAGIISFILIFMHFVPTRIKEFFIKTNKKILYNIVAIKDEEKE